MSGIRDQKRWDQILCCSFYIELRKRKKHLYYSLGCFTALEPIIYLLMETKVSVFIILVQPLAIQAKIFLLCSSLTMQIPVN